MEQIEFKENTTTRMAATQQRDFLNRLHGGLEVLDIDLAHSTMTVNSQAPFRQGDYFRQELSAANSSDPVWQSVSGEATVETTVNGHVFGRRIHKRVWNNPAGTGTPALARKYMYEGWNLILATSGGGSTNGAAFVPQTPAS